METFGEQPINEGEENEETNFQERIEGITSFDELRKLSLELIKKYKKQDGVEVPDELREAWVRKGEEVKEKNRTREMSLGETREYIEDIKKRIEKVEEEQERTWLEQSIIKDLINESSLAQNEKEELNKICLKKLARQPLKP